MHYEYCPHCGQKLVDRQAGDDGLIPYCNSCKKYWFDTFASCVIILIYNEQDEVMLCRQEYLSKEYEVITSGFIIPGETAEAAACGKSRKNWAWTWKNWNMLGPIGLAGRYADALLYGLYP